ncbi:Structural maintenance of chromosome0s protein 6 [Vanrija pseudolonga]|uniref:Structural maintenance of chromosome0s protein 6 n=1 Tax=Vanrija pseudolonga TaxID=143232 RepID=A0AAF1BHG9_9TREE|nr:Structural maintenance of chromosome0s protein 6 [Vanrija pseudolonga]
MAGSSSKRPLRSPDADDSGSDERAEVVKRVKRERMENAGRRSSPPPPEDDESEDEDMSEDDTDSDMDPEGYLEAFRRSKELQKQERKKGQGHEAPTAGTLKSLHLVNFMSHGNTIVTFASKLNFLVGANGSGKSAILTGIAVVFGAKASVTGRGQGVKDLIMRGKDKASIKVVIDNRGKGAYKPNVYGDSITIERTIHSSGASGYTFKSSSGNIIERKREALVNMLDHFVMDIDSPLTILTQDNAKTFLAASNERSLYAFFLNGTQLAPLTAVYDKIKEDVKSIGQDVIRANDVIPDLEAKEKSLRRQMEAAKKVSELKKEEYNLQRQIAWAYVAGKEQECENVRNDVAQSKAKIEKIDETVSEKQGLRSDAERKMERIREEVEETIQQREPLKLQLKQAKEAAHAARKDSEANKNSMADCQEELDSAEREVQELARQIAAASGDQGQNAQEAELRKKKEGAEKALRNMSDQLPKVERDVATGKEVLETRQREAASLNNRRDALSLDLDRGKRQLESLQQSSTNRLARYGNRLDIVLEAIKKVKWRHSPPIGPIGQYVHLHENDFKYRDVLQGVMGSFLCSFAVRHDDDKVTLMRILSDAAKRGYEPLGRRGQVPPILKHAGDVFNYSQGDLSNRTTTIDNEHVLRILIDRFHIERLVLAPTRAEGLDEIKRLLSQGLSEVQLLSADCTQQVGRQGNLFQSSPVSLWGGSSLFIKDVASEITSLSQQVATIKDAHVDAVAKCREQAAGISAAENALAEKNRSLERIEKGLRDLRRVRDSLNEQLADLAPVEGNALLFTKQAREEAVTNLKQELEVLRDKQKQSDVAHAEAIKVADEAEERWHASEPQLQQSKHTLQLLHLKCAEHKTAEDHYKRSRAQTERQLNELQQKLDKVEEEVVDWTQRAEDKWARVEVTQSPEELQARRAVLANRIRDAEKNDNINVDEITVKYNEARANAEEQKAKIRNFEGLVTHLRNVIATRHKTWEVLRSLTSVRAAAAFTHNMGKRGYNGKITFEHEAERLVIAVQTGTQAERSHAAAPLAYKPITSLSGGEKSYTTVSLLLALWETSPTAIRCLDEWDVFMDMMNRQLAAKLLIEGAREATSKQFLLITPQTLSGVPSNMGPDSKIIQLKDPERGQTTLV